MTENSVPNSIGKINPPLCECGCGTPLSPAKHAYKFKGRIIRKGQYFRYIRSHINSVHESRLWEYLCSKSIVENGCRVWNACSDKSVRGTVVFRGKKRQVHIVSWILHNGDIPDGMKVMHKCDNPPCFDPGHLQLGTQKDNVHDAFLKGRMPCGERHWKSKLTERDVREIIKLRSDGMNRYEIADRFHIHFSSVNRIVGRRKWRHLDIPKPELSWACKPKLPQHREEILSMVASGKTFRFIGSCFNATGEAVGSYLRRNPPSHPSLSA